MLESIWSSFFIRIFFFFSIQVLFYSSHICQTYATIPSQRLLSLKTSYNQKVPPIVTVNTTTFRPVPVYITIVMLKIVSLEEIENKVEFQFTCVLNWKENRAQFNNLKKDTALNALTDEVSFVIIVIILIGIKMIAVTILTRRNYFHNKLHFST